MLRGDQGVGGSSLEPTMGCWVSGNSRRLAEKKPQKAPGEERKHGLCLVSERLIAVMDGNLAASRLTEARM